MRINTLDMGIEIEAIKARHSVRKYKDTPIESIKIDQLNNFIEKCNAAGNLHLQLIEDAGKTFNKLMNKAMGLGSAPSVILCVGPDDETLDERVGYYGEQLVLYAQLLGLNTCWAGTFNRKHNDAEVKNGERLVISIAIGYGENQGKPHKSKLAEKVTSGVTIKPEWFNKGVELALLAPTAVNQQSFEIKLNPNETVEIIDKGGVLSGVDKGIVSYHFKVGSEYAKANGQNM